MKYLAAGRNLKILQYQTFTNKIVHSFRLAATQLPWSNILQQLWMFWPFFAPTKKKTEPKTNPPLKSGSRRIPSSSHSSLPQSLPLTAKKSRRKSHVQWLFLEKKTHTIPSMWLIYFPTWMVDFVGFSCQVNIPFSSHGMLWEMPHQRRDVFF